MNISRYRDMLSVVTDFDEFLLATGFRHVELLRAPYNRPVDFTGQGLYRKDYSNPELTDYVLAQCTDEATPIQINGEHIGANHGEPILIRVRCNCGHTHRDIGSVWQDSEGVKFTLLRVSEDCLYFVSENIGESRERYAFKKRIAGKLTHLFGAECTFDIDAAETGIEFLAPCLRYVDRRVFGVKDGNRQIVHASMDADACEIVDDYYIINPATVAEAVISARPGGGYTENPDLSEYGEPMVRYSYIYRILNDGCVLADFEITKLQDVLWHRCMGHMYQHRRNPYLGGVYRYFPKTLPFLCNGVTYDFTLPRSIDSGTYPPEFKLTPEFWLDKNSPPDRVVDFFKDTRGKSCLAFAAGYLPIFDGERSVRCKIAEAGELYSSKKYYPTLKDGDISSVRGVAYKKYFRPINDSVSYYTVEYAGKIYHWLDIFSKDSFNVQYTGKVEVYECYGDLAVKTEKGEITFTGTRGSALVIENLNK